MAIYRVGTEALQPLTPVSFAEAGIREREDLQRLLREQIDAVCPGALAIAEEFASWSEGQRRIDLLAVDADANLIVIELKRTDTGGHMELQALRYAAMVRSMTFEQAVSAYSRYLTSIGSELDAEESLLAFLGWDEPMEDDFAQAVRVVLVSAEFSREVTSTVLWLLEYGLDIECVRLGLYRDASGHVMDIQRLIPLPEAEDYIVAVRHKQSRERSARRAKDYTKYAVTIGPRTLGPLNKRNAALAVLRELLIRGMTVERIDEAAPRAVKRKFVSYPGTLDSDGLVAALEAEHAMNVPSREPDRWFTGDDELVHAAGRTIAVSKMWGRDMVALLGPILAASGEGDIAIAAVDPSEAADAS